jgi:phage shock protein C
LQHEVKIPNSWLPEWRISRTPAGTAARKLLETLCLQCLARVLLYQGHEVRQGVLKMSAQENQVALPLRSHTILGVCEAVGEDFGFNPLFLRVPLAAIVLYSPLLAIGAYLALGVVVLLSRLLFPDAKQPSVSQAQTETGSAREDESELSLAA